MRNNDSRSMEPSVSYGNAQPADPHLDRVQAWLVLLGALMAMIVLSGCASSSVQADADPWAYNHNTGYPFVGGPSFLGR